MALVRIGGQPWGVALVRYPPSPFPQIGAGKKLEVRNMDGSPATVVTDNDPGSTPLDPLNLVANDEGVYPGWINSGQYKKTEQDGEEEIVEAMSGILAAGGAGATIITGTGIPTLGSLDPNTIYYRVDGSGAVIEEYVKTDG